MPTRPLRALALAAGLGLAGTVPTVVVPAAHAASTCDALSAPLYQLLGSNQTSLVTGWEAEYEQADSGFTQQGELGRVALAPATGLTAIHRLYKGGDFVTARAADVATWQGRGYTDQGTYFYAAPSGSGCGVAVHRVVNTQGVHEEVLESGVAAKVAAGWKDVGEKYRVAAAGQAGPTTPVVPAGSFSLGVIPDTQNETLSARNPLLAARNQYLVDHRAETNLAAVLQVGDITNWDTTDHDQYVNAAADMAVLEKAGVPWVGAVGNHDAEATGVGGSARAGVNPHTALRDTATYNSFFTGSHFTLRQSTADGGEENSTHFFTAGGAKWMVLALEVWPRADKLAWAQQQVAAHPDTNVIVLTHDYLNWGGDVSGGNDGYGDLSPAQVRDRLISRYANIKFVFSGHEGLSRVKVEDFDGNRVVAMQNNYDTNTDNLLRMVNVDVANNRLTYSYASVSTSRVVTGDTTVDGMSFIR